MVPVQLGWVGLLSGAAPSWLVAQGHAPLGSWWVRGRGPVRQSVAGGAYVPVSVHSEADLKSQALLF